MKEGKKPRRSASQERFQRLIQPYREVFQEHRDELTEKQRSALEFALDGFVFADIAQAFGTTSGPISNHVRAALKKLDKYMDKPPEPVAETRPEPEAITLNGQVYVPQADYERIRLELQRLEQAAPAGVASGAMVKRVSKTKMQGGEVIELVLGTSDPLFDMLQPGASISITTKEM